MNSLALENDDEKDCSVPCCSPNSESYPTLCLRDNQVKAFLDGQRIEPDKEYTATIRFKMEGWRDSDYGKTLDLKVLGSEGIAEASGMTEEENDSEDKAEGGAEEDPVEKAAYG